MTLRPICICLCLVVLVDGARAQEAQPSPMPPSPEVSLRARLLDFGGVLANEGFRFRDSTWSGRLEAGKPRRLAVNLFAGNQYWFCLAANAADTRPAIALFDPQGEQVTILGHDEDGLAAVGVTALTTGRYVVEIRSPRGPSTEFCLVYLFK